jgi:pimeloyl-ACP methyl ester carboxylesterase
LKGGRLVDARGTLRWVGRRQVLGAGSPIALPLAWDGERQAGDALRADGPVDRVDVVPRVLGRAMYGPWLDFGRRRWGECWHEFAYDWRRDNNETLVHFTRTLTELAAAVGPIDVVAHSMGGLLTLAHLLTAGEAAIRRVVFVGVPFLGGVGYLSDMHLGAVTGLDRRLLAPAVQLSFTSVYAFFPLGGKRVLDRDGGEVDVDLFDPDAWTRHRLGVFAVPGADTPAVRAHLERALATGARFRRSLEPRASTRLRTPILVVTGRGHATPTQIVRGGPRAVRGWDFRSAPAVDGDGRVRAGASTPPAPLAYEQCFTTAEHGDMLSDPAVQRRVADFLA